MDDDNAVLPGIFTLLMRRKGQTVPEMMLAYGPNPTTLHYDEALAINFALLRLADIADELAGERPGFGPASVALEALDTSTAEKARKVWTELRQPVHFLHDAFLDMEVLELNVTIAIEEPLSSILLALRGALHRTAAPLRDVMRH